MSIPSSLTVRNGVSSFFVQSNAIFVVGFTAYSAEIATAYRALCTSFEGADKETRTAAFQPIRDYHASLTHKNTQAPESLQSLSARMYAVKDQFTGLVSILTSMHTPSLTCD